MKGRLWWSSVLPLTAMMCLPFVTAPAAKAQSDAKIVVRQAPEGSFEFNPASSGTKRPGLINPLCGLVGGPALNQTGQSTTFPPTASCDSQDGREWEGLNSTDYLSTVSFDPNTPPNPDIAVGPDDILTMVNGIIARYPNPNAPSATNNGGTAPVTYVGSNYIFPPTSRQWLDVWLGENALNELCPTQTRSFSTCIIENASVRYDQMQGRFVVLFTVVDTGALHCQNCGDLTPEQLVTQNTLAQSKPARRKGSWVLIVSRWAVGCQGTTPTSFTSPVCTPNETPSAPPLPGNTLFFTTANPPGCNQASGQSVPTGCTPNPTGSANSGGFNGNWFAYYGTPDGTCDSVCLWGNINSISDVRRAVSFAGAPVIDCANTAVNSGRLCYLPSSARLGLDNDNIVISSSVYNDNIRLADRLLGGVQLATQAFQGTRLRVHKKSGFYTGVTSIPAIASPACPSISSNLMCPGASQAVTQLQGDFYDLWDTSIPDGGTATFYSFDKSFLQPTPGGSNRTVPGPHYEPEHVRGRSLASYNGNANLDNAFSSIWGTVNQGFTATTGGNPPQNFIYHRGIRYTREPQGLLIANAGSIPASVDTSKIQGGIPTLLARQSHEVPQFQNPNTVTQRDKLGQPPQNNTGLPTPYIYVGDNRPHRVISREGLRYIARVGATPTFTGFSGLPAEATVIYDIVQKPLPTAAAGEVYNTQWGNGAFYAPMHDTPANVVQYGSVSPVNVLPFLEKLFVGTTYPALAPTDTRLQHYGNLPATSLLACTGQEPGVNSNGRAYPGLWDMRCGEDAYDRQQSRRHPISAAFTVADFQVRAQPTPFPNEIVPFGIRGGAATDVNNMGLWLNGTYAKGRLNSIGGTGQWGTYVAHYPLTFPIRDPYNNTISSYADVPPGHIFFPYVQIAKQTEIDPGSRTAPPTENFGVNDPVKRGDMARWTVRSQMDEAAITAYLNSTGGFFCSFADVACPATPSGGIVLPETGVGTTTDASSGWRYMETMYRRGYTKGCADTNDGQRRFCPTLTLTRGEMAVFIIRAKMNSVFPTVTSGAFTTTSCQPNGTLVGNVGDQFGLFVGCNSYFPGDVASTHIYFAFIQKLRELRITNGTDLVAKKYGPSDTLTKGQLMTFLVRAFFP